jgi:hypothetical protein
MDFKEEFNNLSIEGKIDVLFNIVLSNPDLLKFVEQHLQPAITQGTLVCYKDGEITENGIVFPRLEIGVIYERKSNTEYSVIKRGTKNSDIEVHSGYCNLKIAEKFKEIDKVEETLYWDVQYALGIITTDQIVEILPPQVFVYSVYDYFQNGKRRAKPNTVFSYTDIRQDQDLDYIEVKCVPYVVKIKNWFM